MNPSSAKLKVVERINQRCMLLQSYGFTINHEDSSVTVSVDHFNEIEIDFSAVAEDHFLSYAMKKVYEHGLSVGKKEAQDKIKVALGIN